MSKLVRTVKQHTDLSIDFTVARNKASNVGHVQVLPDIGSDGQGKIGVQLQNNATAVRKRVEGPAELAVQSVKETGKILTGTVSGFVDLLSNLGQASQSVSGPVAVVAVGAEVARESPQGAFVSSCFVRRAKVTLEHQAPSSSLPLSRLRFLVECDAYMYISCVNAQ